MKTAARVALPIPRSDFYHYSIPDSLKDQVAIGHRVIVPIKSRKAIGYVIGLDEPPENINLRDLEDVLDEVPLFDEKRLKFFKWVSDYYICPIGIILKAAHPGGLGINLDKVIKITDKGESYLCSEAIDITELQVLNALAAESMAANKLLEIVESATNAAINRLRTSGLIEIDYQLDKKSFIKKERYICTTDKAKNPEMLNVISKKKPAKGRILEFILRNEDIEYPELRELFDNLSGHLRWLEENGYINITEKELQRDPYAEIKISRDKPHTLNVYQDKCLSEISRSLKSNKFAPFLLHGVTGSGKTEVYLRIIEETLSHGKEALVLVPEISLTPQLVKRFKARFGSQIAVLHSGINDSERFDSWRLIREGRIKIAIGARSSIFAPFGNIGIIVVDEEHEQSYKQEESPHYNARDMALVLGKLYGCVVVLGSATPSAETYYNSVQKKLRYLNLPSRATESAIPEVEIVDMKGSENPVLSEPLISALIKNYEDSNQSIVFLNRRGFSSVLVCGACGEILNCPNCSITLTYHKSGSRVKCHYCGLDEGRFTDCLRCGNRLMEFGIGTQKVQEEIEKILPQAVVARMDRDEIRGKRGLLDLYNKLEKNEIDILIGTQMVAKGHDLPGVTLVGVISADMSLSVPDFRAGERTYQLLTQVAGRAGRGDKKGRVIIQTLKPDNTVIEYAAAQDSVHFLTNELNLRSALGYPPFSKLANIKFTGKSSSDTSRAANMTKNLAVKIQRKTAMDSLEILGPSESPISRIKNRYRWQLLVKSSNQNDLHKFTRGLLKAVNLAGLPASVTISADIDPVSFS